AAISWKSSKQTVIAKSTMESEFIALDVRTTIPKVKTFTEKVKKRIISSHENGEKLLKKLEKEPVNTTVVNAVWETPDYTRHLHELVSHKAINEMLPMVKLNALCFTVLQNELPPYEKDLGSFILPCTIGNTTISTTFADLVASISVMSFSMFKCLGLGSPKLINVVIEKADRSMQSLKGIVENVRSKINNFIFLDFRSFLKDNDLLSSLDNQDNIFVSLPNLLQSNDESYRVFTNPDNSKSIGLDDFIERMDDIWDDLDPGILTNEVTNSPRLAINLHVLIGYLQFLIDFIILENIDEFMERGLTEVLFGQPLKEQVGIIEDRVKGVLRFQQQGDKNQDWLDP
ncbi:hypothetical protein Tco_0586239, partial [Tanacetum coccineum]